MVFGCISKRVTHGQIKQIIRILSKASPLLSIDRVRRSPPTPLPPSALGFPLGAESLCPSSSSSQGLESCLKGPDNYNSQVLIEATVIALTKLQPLLSKVPDPFLNGSRTASDLRPVPPPGLSLHVRFCQTQSPSVSRSLRCTRLCSGWPWPCCSWTRSTSTPPEPPCWSRTCTRWTACASSTTR